MDDSPLFDALTSARSEINDAIEQAAKREREHATAIEAWEEKCALLERELADLRSRAESVPA